MRRKIYVLLLLSMLAIPIGLISYKLFALGFPLSTLVPTVSYQTELIMRLHAHGEDVDVSTYLPRADDRQLITDETNNSGPLSFTVRRDGNNRVAVWHAPNLTGEQSIRYTFTARGRHVQYRIPETLEIPTSYPDSLAPYLKEEPGIQMNAPEIVAAVHELIPERRLPLLTILTRIHRHLQDDLANKNFSGYTDALTALRLGEASCNGKSRLFVAFARHLNIPARLVGGLIMQSGTKRISHQWVEVYINGYWVPFDTINDHFAELPANYLTLYYGDLALFKHTANINFQYDFKMLKRLAPNRSEQGEISDSMFRITDFYALFEQIGISQNLLKILMMLPLGALVTVLFRNVIGVRTFGTFLPALIAAAARETGLLWGMVGFTFIIALSYGIRRFLDWLHLLHSPKMAIMLTAVVVILLAITVIGVHTGLFDLAHISLFPIAILAITAERFAIIEVEQGLREALQITSVTLLVIAACYAVMDSLFLQSMILTFPELLLVVIALNLWLGKWVGMRLLEFVRFRHVILKGT